MSDEKEAIPSDSGAEDSLPIEEAQLPEKEIDLNQLFPDEEPDLNELFPDPEMKTLLKKVNKNQKDIRKLKDRFREELWENEADLETSGTD